MMTLVILNPEFEIKDSGLHFKKGRLKNVSEHDVFYAKGGRSPQVQTTTQTSQPWGPQQSHLTAIFKRAKEQADIPGFVEPDPRSIEALEMGEARARAGSPVMRQMQEQLRSTLAGEQLYGGPAFTRAVEAAQRQVIPQVQSQFARAGRGGSGLSHRAMTEALGDVFAKQFAQERQNQLRAMLFAPQAAEADYADIARLGAIGSEREAIEQQRLQDPRARLREYLAMVSGGYGGETTQTIPIPRRQSGGVQGALGGALSGAQLGGMFVTIGSFIGVVGGGLLGGFL